MSCVIRRDNEEQMLMYNWISSVTSSLDSEITPSLFDSPPFVILIGNVMLQEKFNLLEYYILTFKLKKTVLFYFTTLSILIK